VVVEQCVVAECDGAIRRSSNEGNSLRFNFQVVESVLRRNVYKVSRVMRSLIVEVAGTVSCLSPFRLGEVVIFSL